MESLNRFFFIFSLVMTSFVLWSCQQVQYPAVVVVALDDFSVDDVVCNQDQLASERSGWFILCRDSVRFTHAYTTSTMSVPALASVLTGTYPYQHGLHTNSGQSLKPELETIAEEAVGKHWRTAFFSGGAPVFRKTGLHQGFESFDDIWNISPEELFKPFKQSVAGFREWSKDGMEHSPFLSVFYAPDLAYSTGDFRDEILLSKGSSFVSRLAQLDESLYELFQILEKSKRWKDSLVVVLGLHGRPKPQSLPRIKGANLSSGNLQVGLFIKPIQKGQLRTPWTIDRPVNLADVGKSLQEIISGDRNPSMESAWPITSLNKDLQGPAGNGHSESRPLLIESFWEPWLGLAGWSRAAVVLDDQLWAFTPQLKAYNLLLEFPESTALKASEIKRGKLESIKTQLAQIGFPTREIGSPPPAVGHSLDWRTRVLEIPYNLWIEASLRKDLLKRIVEIFADFPKQPEVAALALRIAIEVEDWTIVAKIGKERKDLFLENLALNQLQGSRRPLQNVCFDLGAKKKLSAHDYRKCSDSMFNKYLIEKSKKDPLREFEKFYDIVILREAIRKTDLALQIRVDPKSLDVHWPSYFELFLTLPENQKLQSQLLRSVQRNYQEEIN